MLPKPVAEIRFAPPGRIANAKAKLDAVMARAADSNGWMLRAIAVGSITILIGVVSWTLVTVLTNSNENARAISAINAKLDRMEMDMQRILDD